MLPLSTSHRIYGNTQFNNAEIICVIDAPLDIHAQKSNINLVNQIGKECLIMIGFAEKGTEVCSSFEYKATYGLNDNHMIKGWDLPEVQKLKRSFDRDFTFISEMEKQILQDIENRNWYSFMEDNSCFNTLLKITIPVENTRIIEKKYILSFLDLNLVQLFISSIKFLILKAKTNYNRKCADLYQKIFRARQTSLKDAIESELKQKRTLNEKQIIVFLEKDQVLDPEMFAFLQTRKCVAISSIMLPEIFPQDMKHLWGEKELPLANSEPIKIDPSPGNISDLPVRSENPKPTQLNGSLTRVRTSKNLLTLSPDDIENE